MRPLATNASGCHDSLSLDMSNMSLDVDRSSDSVVVDAESSCDAVQSTDYNFFIITLRSHVIIRTVSSDVVCCSWREHVTISRLFLQPRITLDSIKGMDKQVKLLYEIVVIPLSTPDSFKSRGMSSI